MTNPNDVLEPFHNRCPLVIEPKDYDRRLTPYLKEDPSTVQIELVRTYPSQGDEGVAGETAEGQRAGTVRTVAG